MAIAGQQGGGLPVRPPGPDPLEAAPGGRGPGGRGRAAGGRAPGAAGAPPRGGSPPPPVLLPAVALALRRVVDVPLGPLYRQPGGAGPSAGRGLRQSTINNYNNNNNNAFYLWAPSLTLKVTLQNQTSIVANNKIKQQQHNKTVYKRKIGVFILVPRMQLT